MVTCFTCLLMHSLRKASQINKRPWMGSIYKQAPSRNLNCSVVCFPLLHCLGTADRQPGYAFSRRDQTKKSLGPNCSKDLQILQGQWIFKTRDFRLKMKKGQAEDKTGGWRVWERMTDWGEKASCKVLTWRKRRLQLWEIFVQGKKRFGASLAYTHSPTSQFRSRGN